MATDRQQARAARRQAAEATGQPPVDERAWERANLEALHRIAVATERTEQYVDVIRRILFFFAILVGLALLLMVVSFMAAVGQSS